MSLIYRLLGMVAALTRGLSQLRLTYFFLIPIAPFHWLLMIGFLAAAYFFALSARDGLINEPTPTALSFKEVFEREDLTNRYVSVSGMLVPAATQTFVTKHRGGGETVDAVYVPFVTEDQANSVLLVKYKEAPPKKGPHQATVTGMLRAPNARLKEKSTEIRNRFAPATIDWTNVLDADDRPPRPWPFVALSSACAILCAMMLYTRLKNWTIYRRLGRTARDFADAPSAAEEVPDLDLRVTGSFTLPGGALRLHDAPAQLVLSPEGELTFAAMVVEDKNLMPGSIVIQPDTVESWDEGVLYYGFTARPAVRLRFIDGNTGRESVAFVKLPDEAQREAFLQLLAKTPGYNLF
jgi:hypothetical protein